MESRVTHTQPLPRSNPLRHRQVQQVLQVLRSYHFCAHVAKRSLATGDDHGSRDFRPKEASIAAHHSSYQSEDPQHKSSVTFAQRTRGHVHHDSRARGRWRWRRDDPDLRGQVCRPLIEQPDIQLFNAYRRHRVGVGVLRACVPACWRANARD